jgi:hypothetical protein
LVKLHTAMISRGSMLLPYIPSQSLCKTLSHNLPSHHFGNRAIHPSRPSQLPRSLPTSFPTCMLHVPLDTTSRSAPSRSKTARTPPNDDHITQTCPVLIHESRTTYHVPRTTVHRPMSDASPLATQVKDRHVLAASPLRTLGRGGLGEPPPFRRSAMLSKCRKGVWRFTRRSAVLRGEATE